LCSAAENYYYIGYIAYPKNELRGFAVEELPSGAFEFHKYIHPVVTPGATAVGAYVYTNPATPSQAGLFILGIEPNNARALYNCGKFDLESTSQIQCLRQPNSPTLGGASQFSGGSPLSGVITLNVSSRKGNSDFSQGLRFNPAGVSIQNKYAYFAAPYREFPANTLISLGVGWDVSLAAESTTSQLILRGLSPQTGSGKGNAVAYNYNPTSRIASLALTNRLQLKVGLFWREQRNIGTTNAQSSVWKAEADLSSGSPALTGPPVQVVGWKKTGNTNGELFGSVAVSPDSSFIVHTNWLPACKLFGLTFRAQNENGTYRVVKQMETCSTLMGTTVGAIGLNVSPTYLED
jgi:hypothetical protein